MDLHRYKIRLPFWSRRHPHSDEFQRNTREWAHRFGLVRSPATLEKFDALGYGRLMSYASPDGRDDHVQLLADWNTLFEAALGMFPPTEPHRIEPWLVAATDLLRYRLLADVHSPVHPVR